MARFPRASRPSLEAKVFEPGCGGQSHGCFQNVGRIADSILQDAPLAGLGRASKAISKGQKPSETRHFSAFL